MFSFFGKKEKKEEPAAGAAAASASESTPVTTAAPSATATAPAPAADPYPEPSAGTESPWAEAAAGLNLDALLAPTPTPATPAQPEVGPPDPARTEALKPQIVEALSTIYDPEIPVNIYELGLIYEVTVDADDRVAVKMTLTSPACPSAQQLPSEARYKVKAVPGVSDCAVEVVWEPPWTKDMMSETAKLSLGIF